MTDSNSQLPNNTPRNILLGGFVVALLAVAAFVGGNLLRKQQDAVGKEEFQIIAAEGLPETPFEQVGEVLSQEGNSLFVQAKQMNEALGMIGGKGIDKKGDSSDTGPATEVVLSHNTEFYRDSTWDAYLSGEVDKENLKDNEIQQEIVPGSRDELGPGSEVTVWGERNGDRIVAEFILYSLPFPTADKKIFPEK